MKKAGGGGGPVGAEKKKSRHASATDAPPRVSLLISPCFSCSRVLHVCTCIWDFFFFSDLNFVYHLHFMEKI